MEQNLEPIRKTSGTGIYQVLRYALSFGAGVRQFSRLTGVSFGVVQKLKNDHFRTDPVIPPKLDSHLNDTSALESEIDRIVYHLYGLTDEEVRIVEGKD